MTALFDHATLRGCDHRRDDRDWLDAYRQAEAEAEAAAEMVREISAIYSRERTELALESYRAADRRYDAARFVFQVATAGIVGGVRAIAGIARHMQLADASDKARML